MAAPEVRLRPLQADDKDRLLAWRNSPEVASHMYTNHTIGQVEHDRWFAEAVQHPRRVYWIIELDGAPVGLANLYDIERSNGRCAWAYYLADPSVRGKGVGAYVEFLVIEQVFGEIGLEKLWCEVIVANEAVARLHQKFGFKQEALLRRHIVRADGPQDVFGLGLLREDWTFARPRVVRSLNAAGFQIPAEPE